jgi:hypothetical protein
MAKQKKVWVNSKGEEVPASAISVYDKEKDKIALALASKSIKVSEQLVKLRASFEDAIKGLFVQHLSDKGVKIDDVKGSFTFYSYDKSVKVEIKNQDTITFDDTILIVQAKLDEFIESISGQMSDEYSVIIRNAFKTRRGQLDKVRLLSLFEYEITHPLWIEAMDALRKSITTASSKRYINIALRQEDGSYEYIPLSFSKV